MKRYGFRKPVLNAPLDSITFTIYGEPASKANSRRIVRVRGKGGRKRIASIKSAKALSYVDSLRVQAARIFASEEPLTGELSMTAHIFYRTQRPDLDPSLILDGLQGYAMKNDRQVREMHLFHHIDKLHPRALITIAKRVGASA